MRVFIISFVILFIFQIVTGADIEAVKWQRLTIPRIDPENESSGFPETINTIDLSKSASYTNESCMCSVTRAECSFNGMDYLTVSKVGSTTQGVQTVKYSVKDMDYVCAYKGPDNKITMYSGKMRPTNDGSPMSFEALFNRDSDDIWQLDCQIESTDLYYTNDDPQAQPADKATLMLTMLWGTHCDAIRNAMLSGLSGTAVAEDAQYTFFKTTKDCLEPEPEDEPEDELIKSPTAEKFKLASIVRGKMFAF